MSSNKKKKGSLPYLSLDQIRKKLLSWVWVVDQLLMAGRVYLMHGQWKVGKSLVALDLGLHLGQGRSWCSHQVSKCLVVYVAGEAEFDIQARIQAFIKRHGINRGATFFLRCLPVHLTDEKQADQLREEIEQIQKYLKNKRDKDDPEIEQLPLIVFIDTLARNFGPGKSESSDTDMGAFINNLIDRVTRPLNATTIVVHHPGHTDKNRARGHSSLPGAVDGTLQVEQKNGVVSLSTKEMRNTKTNRDSLGWTIEGVDLGVLDNFGNAVNAPVLVPVSGQNVILKEKEKREQEHQRKLNDCCAAIRSRLEDLAKSRKTDPENPEYYPSRKKLKDELKEKFSKAIGEEALKTMTSDGTLVDKNLPDGVKIQGRNKYTTLANDCEESSAKSNLDGTP